MRSLPHRLGEILDHPGCQQWEREHEEARPGDAHPVVLNVWFESGVVLVWTQTLQARVSSSCQDDKAPVFFTFFCFLKKIACPLDLILIRSNEVFPSK